MTARSAASAGALSLPDSARQREQAAALEAALLHSAAEVEDLLGALDMAAAAAAATGAADAADGTLAADGVPAQQPEEEAGAASEAGLASLRDRLAERHRSVQAAAAGMQAAAAEAERLKGQHAELRQRVSGLVQASMCVCGRWMGTGSRCYCDACLPALPRKQPSMCRSTSSNSQSSATRAPLVCVQVEEQQNDVDAAQDAMEAALEQKQGAEAALTR